VAGYTSSVDGDVTFNHGGVGDADFWVVKLSAAGGIDWQKTYGGSFNEMAYSISNAPDGGFVVAGSAASNDGDVTCYVGNLDGWVIKISATGALQWQKIIGGLEFDEAHSVHATDDGGAIVAIYSASKELPGYHADLASSVGDFLIAKISIVNGPPVLTILAPPANICAGTLVTLQTSATNVGLGASYQWTRNGVNVGTNSPTYTASDFANNDQVICTVTTAVPAGCGQTNMAVPSNTITLTVSSAVPPVIKIAVDAPGPVCFGTTQNFTATVTGGNPMPVYQWLLNGQPAPGAANIPTYSSTILTKGDVVSCVYSDNAPCVAPGVNTSNAIPVQVIETVAPSVSITAGVTSVCAGSAVSFKATAVNGGTAPVYQWEVNGIAAPGATNSASYSSSVLSDGDVVDCVVSSNAPCATPVIAVSNNITVTIKAATPSAVQIDYTSGTLCQGQPVVFTATPTNAGPTPVYQWQVNGRNAGSHGNTYTSTFLQDGDVVSVVVSDAAAGCILPSSNSVSVSVRPSPAVATGKGIILSVGQSATLDLSPTGDIVNYSWSPSVGLSDPGIANPVAQPAATTTYTLTVTTGDGCAASGTITVKVFASMSVPNAFTPSGDGHNDIFYVIGGPLGSKVKDFGVFDRWGQRVFQVHDVAPDDSHYGWDGRINGVAAPTGTYVYEIAMSFADGSTHVYKGTVMLVR
jgi:gliding motility-associated-like protein